MCINKSIIYSVVILPQCDISMTLSSSVTIKNLFFFFKMHIQFFLGKRWFLFKWAISNSRVILRYRLSFCVTLNIEVRKILVVCFQCIFNQLLLLPQNFFSTYVELTHASKLLLLQQELNALAAVDPSI